MRKNPEAPRRVYPSHTRGAGRRRRLHRGAELWNADRLLCAERTRRAALITLTISADDPARAHGLARAFWARVRNAWIGTRYFCWTELHKRNQVHYHAIWLNPPHRRRADLLAWVDRWWPHGRTRVRFKDAAWMDRDAMTYVLGYVKKMGSKYYQQDYDRMPRELRTFMSQRLEIPPGELKHHIDRDEYRYVPESYYRGQHQPEYLELVGRAVHVVPRGCQCTAVLQRRRRAPGRGHRYRYAPRASPPLRRASSAVRRPRGGGDAA